MMRGYVLTVELKAGAKLYHYPQQVGGHRWALTGAKVVPASLDETCDQLVKEGWLVPGDERNEWVLWQTASSNSKYTPENSGSTSVLKNT